MLDSHEVEDAMLACPALKLAATLTRVLEKERTERESVLRTEPAHEVLASEDGRFAAERTGHGLRVFRERAKGDAELVARVTVDGELGGARFLSDGRLLIRDASDLVVVDLETLRIDRLQGATLLTETTRHVLVDAPGKVRLLSRPDFAQVAKVDLRGPAPSALTPLLDRAGDPIGAIVGNELISFETGRSVAVFSATFDASEDGERALACVKPEGEQEERYAVISTRTGAVSTLLPNLCDGTELTLDASGRYVLWLETTEGGGNLVIVSWDIARHERRTARTKLPPHEMAAHLGRTRKGLCIWTQSEVSTLDMECRFRVVARSGAVEHVPSGHASLSASGNVRTIFGGAYRFEGGELLARGSDRRLLASAEAFARAPHVLLTPAAD